MSKRTVQCTNNDLIILARQITEFQEGAEKSSLKLPAEASYMIHRNEQLIMQKYAKYEKQRIALLKKYVEVDKDGKPVMDKKEGEDGKEQVSLKFKDEKAFDKDFQELLAQELEIQFYLPFNVEDKIKGIEGEQKILNQMWYLLEVFENWDPKNSQDESE